MSSNEKTLKQALTEAKLARLLPLFKEEDIESVADFTGLEKEDLDEFVNELKGTKNKLSLGERSRLRVLFKELKALDSVVSPSFPESPNISEAPMLTNPTSGPVSSALPPAPAGGGMMRRSGLQLRTASRTAKK